MKANELRLGNCVTTEYKSDDYFLVCSIEDEAGEIYCVEPGKKTLCGGTWEAIPLDEKWLHRLGFKLAEKDLGIWQLIIDKKHIALAGKGGFDIVAPVTGGIATARCCVNGWWSTRSLRYVHEIQNAYFAITGEELTITIK